MKNSELPLFDTEQDALSWMYDQVDDTCIDNQRFAFQDDAIALQKYSQQVSDGCCGNFDAYILVAGKNAIIGCNYGH